MLVRPRKKARTEREVKSLSTIIIGHEVYKKYTNGADMVGDLLAACPNVRSLSVVEDHGLWASAFATQLEKLEVISSSTRFFT